MRLRRGNLGLSTSPLTLPTRRGSLLARETAIGLLQARTALPGNTTQPPQSSTARPSRPTDTLAAWKFEGNTTRNRFDILFDAGIAPGAIVWICAFWFNPRTQQGPTSEPVSTRVQGGLASAAA
jgi:hypothetical protein